MSFVPLVSRAFDAVAVWRRPPATTNHAPWVRITVHVGEHAIDVHGPAGDWDAPRFPRVCAKTLERLFRAPLGVEARADLVRARLEPVDFDAFVAAVERHGTCRVRHNVK